MGRWPDFVGPVRDGTVPHCARLALLLDRVAFQHIHLSATKLVERGVSTLLAVRKLRIANCAAHAYTLIIQVWAFVAVGTEGLASKEPEMTARRTSGINACAWISDRASQRCDEVLRHSCHTCKIKTSYKQRCDAQKRYMMSIDMQHSLSFSTSTPHSAGSAVMKNLVFLLVVVASATLASAASLRATAICPAFAPTGTDKDAAALFHCSFSDQTVSNVQLNCHSSAYLTGTTVEVVLTTSCGAEERRVIAGAAEACSFSLTLERPPSCGDDSSAVDVNMTAVVEVTGGQIWHSAGINGGAYTPRLTTATSEQTASWTLRIKEDFTSSTAILPAPFTSHILGFTAGRRYSIQTAYSYPEAVSHAVVEGKTLVWHADPCESHKICTKVASFVPENECNADEQAAGFQTVLVSVRSTQVCGEADASEFRCVLGRSSTTYWSDVVSVPCPPITVPPIVENFHVEADLDTVASSDTTINGNLFMVNSAGTLFNSYHDLLQVTTYPAVSASTPIAEVITQPSQTWTLIHDNKATPHAVAWNVFHDPASKKKHPLALSLPLHDEAYGLQLHLGDKVVVDVSGSLAFADRRLLEQLPIRQRLLLEKLEFIDRTLNEIPSRVRLSSRLVVSSEGVSVCANDECNTDEGSTCDNFVECNKWTVIFSASGFLVAIAAFVGFKKYKKANGTPRNTTAPSTANPNKGATTTSEPVSVPVQRPDNQI